MEKRTVKPGTLLYPVPAVMVSCGDMESSNIITVAWTGIINSEPPMTYVSVRPSRHSHDLIEKSGEFIINLVPSSLVKEMDWCGCVSGRKYDKFKEMNFTKEKGEMVSCPMIGESPVNLECKVVEVKKLPSHDMFLAEIVNVHVGEEYFTNGDRMAVEKMKLVSDIHSEYFAPASKMLGKMGFSVMKPKTRKRLIKEGKIRK